MTNEEAIKLLSQIKDVLLASNSWLPSTHNPIKESFGMAINALTAQEKAQEVSNNSPELDKENGKLISRKAAIDACLELLETRRKWDTAEGRAEMRGINPVMCAIHDLPSAQPEIVRCRDCKHWKEGTVYSYCNKLFGMGVLDVYDYMTQEDDFCSMAERKTDEKENI